MKIGTIIGARPQFIKAALVSKKIENNKFFSECIIHTGQHFQKNMSNIFFDEMEISYPKYNLGINQLKYGEMVSKMKAKIQPILIKEKIKGVLLYGDTNSTLAGSLAATALNIPIFHVEAGLRSYNRSMHEENNRLITDHLSSLLFCPTINAVNNLKKEGISKGVQLSGDVMYDAYLNFASQVKKSQKINIKSSYVLATLHRRENLDSNEKLFSIFNNLDKINKEIKVVMPLHPHTKKKLKDFNINSNIELIEPMGYMSMLDLIRKCKMVITDSGGLQKEAFFAKKNCLTIRDQTEWTELIENGSNLLSAPNLLQDNYNRLIEKKCDFSKNLYGNGGSCELILKSIEIFYRNRKNL